MNPIKQLVAILLTAAISLFATSTFSADAPKVVCKVKVLNPDGTPADRASIHVTTIKITEIPPTSPREKPTYTTGTSGSSGGTNKEGNYSFEAAPKASVLIYSYRTALSKTLVSQPVVFTVNEGGNDITLQLQEGTLVYGTAKFEDGPPAKDRTIVGCRPIDPPLPGINEMDIDNMTKNNVNNAFKSNFILEFQTQVQADGKYELYLPPGGFSVKEYDDREGKRAVPVSIEFVKEGDRKEEHRIDFLSVPAPLRGKFVKEDGTDPGYLEVYHATKSAGSWSYVIQSGGEFTYHRLEGSFFVTVTKDRSLGIIYPVPDDKLAEFHTIVLKPMAMAKFELRDSVGQPIVGKKIVVSVINQTGIAHLGTTIPVLPSQTDEQGVAEFKLPPGTGRYEFSWEGGEFECDQTLNPGETAVIAR